MGDTIYPQFRLIKHLYSRLSRLEIDSEQSLALQIRKYRAGKATASPVGLVDDM